MKIGGVCKVPTCELEEFDSGLPQSFDLEVDVSNGTSSEGNRLEQTKDFVTRGIKTVPLEETSTVPLNDAFVFIPIDTPPGQGLEISGNPAGVSESDQSTSFEKGNLRNQGEHSSATLRDSSLERTIDRPHNQNAKFVRSNRVTSPSGKNTQLTSTPLRYGVNWPFTLGKLVHSVRPLPEMTPVRVNRAFKLRFTENQEKKYLRDARKVSYSFYISTAKVLYRVPELELGAGFP